MEDFRQDEDAMRHLVRVALNLCQEDLTATVLKEHKESCPDGLEHTGACLQESIIQKLLQCVCMLELLKSRASSAGILGDYEAFKQEAERLARAINREIN